MASWFPDVDSAEGARNASKGGFYGAIGFAVMVVLGLLVILFTGALPGQPPSPEAGRAWEIGGVLTELLLVLAAAWRFRRGKGLYIGGVVFLIFLAEIAMKFLAPKPAFAWIFLYLAIAAGLINGLRGAWALRNIGDMPSDLENIFR